MITEYADSEGKLRRCSVMRHVSHIQHIHVVEPHLNPCKGVRHRELAWAPSVSISCRHGRVGDSFSAFVPLVGFDSSYT